MSEIAYRSPNQEQIQSLEECKQKLKIIKFCEEIMAEFKITREKLREEYTRKMRSEQLKKQVENESVQSKQLKEMNLEKDIIEQVESKLSEKFDIITKRVMLKMSMFQSEFSDCMSIINRLKSKPNTVNESKIINKLLNLDLKCIRSTRNRNYSLISPQIQVCGINSITYNKIRSTSFADHSIKGVEHKSFRLYKRSSSMNLK